MGQPAVKRVEELKRNEKKWSKPLMDAGWTVFPSVILDRQQALGLTSTDICILMHLAKYWWYEDNLPHPSKKAIADCMNVSESTVQRRIRLMEKACFIKRQKRYHPKSGGQQTNAYDFSGLISSATPYAQEAIQGREAKRKEGEERRKRKQPLRVVNNDE